MSHQEMVCLMVLAAVFCLAAVFLIYGGFKAMQSFGVIIRKITFWPIEKYRERREIARIERQWMDYIESHREELVSKLMRSAHQEMGNIPMGTKKRNK